MILLLFTFGFSSLNLLLFLELIRSTHFFLLIFLTKTKRAYPSLVLDSFFSLTRGNFFYLPFVALRRLPPKVLLASTSLEGEGGLILAETYLFILVSTLKERPAGKQGRFVLSVSKHRDDSCAWCPRPRRGLSKAASFCPWCV